jgi:carbonic anhydrase
MSNQNISIQNVLGNCDLKCSYSFKYAQSNSTATNNGVAINLTYDSRSVPQVIYNTAKYNVSSIMIVSPSLHLFNGSNMPGEILIEHTPVKGGNNLNVCVPFVSSTDSTSASVIITEIIQSVATNAPSDGDSTNLNLSDFNLQNIIPRKPYFAYSYETNDYIVFGSLEAIPLSSSTISTLQQIIQPYSLSVPTAPLYYNTKGPAKGIQLGDGLYISCQPTGSSEDETAVTYDKNTSSIDFSSIIESPIFKYIIMAIIGCILFIIIFYGINIFYNYLSSDAVKLPSIPKFS